MQKLLTTSGAVEELLQVAFVMEAALHISKLVVANEIMGRESSGKQLSVWPDLLTGCVSGGGIEDALAKFAEFKKSHNITSSHAEDTPSTPPPPNDSGQ